jgi:PP-loop superfamily ATP-utilizing enzyme
MECLCKSFHKFIKSGHAVTSNIKRIWKVKVPVRMQIFAWIMLQNKILTASNSEKERKVTEICYICKQDEEMIHQFNHCTFFSCVLSKLAMKFQLSE